MPRIDLNGQTISYRVRSSRRAKRVSIRCSLRDGLEVVYPLGRNLPAPEEVIRERSAWILSTIDRIDRVRQGIPAREYREGETFLFRGLAYGLQIRPEQPIAEIVAELSADRLVLAIPTNHSGFNKRDLRSAVLRFYRDRALEYLPLRLRYLADKHGFEYAVVRVKNQKTRWGSCSAKRNINLNLRLMMAPAEAIDYVLIHELCHLRHLRHDAAFWSLVESICPQYRHWVAWFKTHGPSLIL